MSSICNVPVSIGELWDKYSILIIKQNNIQDENKLKIVKNELAHLEPLIKQYQVTDELYNKLLSVNNFLWDVEDKLRIKEKEQSFDDDFIQLARKVYFTNDERSEIKEEINRMFNSNIFEVKSYVNYK